MPGDDSPEGFSYDIENPKYRTLKEGEIRVDYSITDASTGKMNIDYVEGKMASRQLKRIVDAIQEEGISVREIRGYATDKLEFLSDPQLQRLGNLVSANLGKGWKATMTKVGDLRFVTFTR